MLKLVIYSIKSNILCQRNLLRNIDWITYGKVIELNEKIDKLKEDIDPIKEEIEALKDDIDELKKDNDSINNKIDRIIKYLEIGDSDSGKKE